MGVSEGSTNSHGFGGGIEAARWRLGVACLGFKVCVVVGSFMQMPFAFTAGDCRIKCHIYFTIELWLQTV